MGFLTWLSNVLFGINATCVKLDNRNIFKINKRQHKSLEFGHTHGEIKKNPTEKYINIQGGVKLKKPSIIVIVHVGAMKIQVLVVESLRKKKDRVKLRKPSKLMVF